MLRRTGEGKGARDSPASSSPGSVAADADDAHRIAGSGVKGTKRGAKVGKSRSKSKSTRAHITSLVYGVSAAAPSRLTKFRSSDGDDAQYLEEYGINAPPDDEVLQAANETEREERERQEALRRRYRPEYGHVGGEMDDAGDDGAASGGHRGAANGTSTAVPARRGARPHARPDEEVRSRGSGEPSDSLQQQRPHRRSSPNATAPQSDAYAAPMPPSALRQPLAFGSGSGYSTDATRVHRHPQGGSRLRPSTPTTRPAASGLSSTSSTGSGSGSGNRGKAVSFAVSPKVHRMPVRADSAESG